MKTDMESTLRDGTLAASDDLLARATATVADMLEDTNRVATRLARYHTRLGDYAGSTFLDLNPNNPLAIEASDLFALSLLNVAVPASAARRVLEPGATSAYLSRLLGQDALSTDLNLAVATAGTFVAMRDLHAAVEVAIAAPQLRGSQSREAASKLLSRKRPDLFPGRDEVVKGVLGGWCFSRVADPADVVAWDNDNDGFVVCLGGSR